MKASKTRISFGKEQKIIQHGVDSCCFCQTREGTNHLPGCEMEECPQCHCMLIGCFCDCLSNHEAAEIIEGLYKKFSSLADALNDFPSITSGLKSSYLDHAAVQYIFENVPATVRQELIEQFRNKFPQLIPQIEDAEGTPYYSAEQLSQTFNIPLAEVQEKIDAMVSAGKHIRTYQGVDYKKKH